MKNGFRVYDTDTHIDPAADVLERYVDPPALDRETYNHLIVANRARYGVAAAEGKREPRDKPAPVPAPPAAKKAGFELGSPELL